MSNYWIDRVHHRDGWRATGLLLALLLTSACGANAQITYERLKSFGNLERSGAYPNALVEASNGVLYGTTTYGGTSDAGTVFQVNRDGSGYAVLRHFTGAGGDATWQGALIEGRDGTLYGTTGAGGGENAGTIFKLNKDGSSYEVLHNFEPLSGDGSVPNGLVEGRDGILY